MPRVLLLLAVLFAVPASAAGQAPPERGVVVASIPGAELRAYDQGKDLCLAVTTTPPGAGSSSCGDAPVRIESRGSATVVAGGDGIPPSAAGAVPARAARVEVVPTRGATVAIDTVAGEAYRGRARGRVRFFFAALPEGSKPLEVRLLAADGTLLAVEEVGLGEREPVVGPLRIGTVRDGRRSLRVEAEQTEQLQSNLLDPGHHTRYACIALRGRSAGVNSDDDTLTSSCRSLDLGAAFGPQYTPGCGPARTYLSGIYEAGERAATIVLGSGRRVRARSYRLPRSVGGGRAWLAVVPGDEAVRRIESEGRDPVVLGLPLARPRCRTQLGFTAFLIGFDVTEGSFGVRVRPVAPLAPAAGSGPGTLLAADAPFGGLCLALRHRALRGSDCLPLGVGDDGRAISRPLPGGRRTVGGVTARRAASVTVRFTDGAVAQAPVGDVPPAGYAGGYRGKVRFYALTARTTGRLRQVTLRDAAGKALSVQDVGPPYGTLGSVRRFAGSPPLYAARARFRGTGTDTYSLSCVADRPVRDAEDCWSFDLGFNPVRVRADCVPRRLTVVGRVRPAARAVELVLADGRRQAVPIRRGRVFGVRLGSRVGLREIRISSPRGVRRLPLGLPPAAEQCGYETNGL